MGLLPEVREGTGEPLDLSGSTLRTVSGYHLEYLRNIGVASSMSVSLLHEGELWGLIACHGDAPRRLTPEVRAACEFFGIALSLQLAAVAEREQADELSGYRRALATLLARLSSQAPEALLRPAPDWSNSCTPTVRCSCAVRRWWRRAARSPPRCRGCSGG